MIYLGGGPGGSTLTDADFWWDFSAPFRTHRDFILLDQRGTGYSNPNLDCPEFAEEELKIFSVSETPQQRQNDEAAAALKWRTRLVSEGADLTAYNSIESAADVEDLRKTLGITQWNLYGVSYGTHLALTVMRDYPKGLRSVILDLVDPLQAVDYVENPANWKLVRSTFIVAMRRRRFLSNSLSGFRKYADERH